MKKKVLLTVFLSILLCGFGFSQGKFGLNISVGYANKASLGVADYGWDWTYRNAVTINENGMMSPDLSGSLMFGGEIFYFLSENFAIGLSIANAKQNVDVNADYSMYWQWYTGASSSESNYWTGTGSVRVTPLSLNLIYRLEMSSRTSVNLKIGAAYIMAKVDTTGDLGFAGALLYNKTYYVDYYRVPMELDESVNSFGGHFAVDLEQRISPKISLYLGAEYYYAKGKQLYWSTIPQSQLDGLLGQLVYNGTPDVGTITSEFKPSFFAINGGVKIYF